MALYKNSKELDAGWNFNNTYITLPNMFYSRFNPTPVSNPSLIILNETLTKQLGLDAELLKSKKIMPFLAGNIILAGAEPIAMAYAGHQFGHFSILGDGRAILLGEHITPDGKRVDIHLKGSGITPYSRGGDGRAALKPMLREYIISETMYALGISTTRSLAIVKTGESLFRGKPVQGGILTRVAASHIRVGTFELAARKGNVQMLKELTDYVIKRHYPESLKTDNPYQSFLSSVVDKQALLIAKSMLVGFIHGVMNTDNMSISGEMIDYGPCAFMDDYDPATVFSSIDYHGRYAYGNQPFIAKWNLERFAESMLPLLDNDSNKSIEIVKQITDNFFSKFKDYWLIGMRQKLGFFTEETSDQELVYSLLEIMHLESSDFTNTFLMLTKILEGAGEPAPLAFRNWIDLWLKRIELGGRAKYDVISLLCKHNPVYIPRNHLVEEALTYADEENDFSKFDRLLKVLNEPFKERSEFENYSKPPLIKNLYYKTYCGT